MVVAKLEIKHSREALSRWHIRRKDTMIRLIATAVSLVCERGDKMMLKTIKQEKRNNKKTIIGNEEIISR